MVSKSLAPRLIWEQFLLQWREDAEWIVDQEACGRMTETLGAGSIAGKQWSAWKLYVADLKMKGDL